MDNRQYNIFFNLHTVSGIVISALLYVILFAGSFSFFRDEINNWQRGTQATTHNYLDGLDIDGALKSLDSPYVMRGRTIEFSRPHSEGHFIAHMDPTQDSLAGKRGRIHEYLYLDNRTLKPETYEEGYRLGEFIYRLHFLAQMPYPYGYYLAGFTALFFLFAILTGVLVHWKKIVSNFYVFRPKEKLKTIWTDAHTALGMIGLPFQFVYAVTGSFFLINIFLVAPTVMNLYDGNQETLYEELEFIEKPLAYENRLLGKDFSVNAMMEAIRHANKDFHITGVCVQNIADASMRVIVRGTTSDVDQIVPTGKYVIRAQNGETLFQRSPNDSPTYLEWAKTLLYRLHYGDYAGYPLKIVSFVLGLISCLVILSGVMLWLVAREKKNMDERKRRFNRAVARIYLSLSLGMFPVIAASFLFVLYRPKAGEADISLFFFPFWIIVTAVLIWTKDLGKITQASLLSGSVLGLAIPVLHGISRGWFWENWQGNFFQIGFVDLFWLVLSVIGLLSYIAILKKEAKKKTALS